MTHIRVHIHSYHLHPHKVPAISWTAHIPSSEIVFTVEESKIESLVNRIQQLQPPAHDLDQIIMEIMRRHYFDRFKPGSALVSKSKPRPDVTTSASEVSVGFYH